MRIMLDTNILISAFVFKSKILNSLIEKLSKGHRIIICSYSIEEIQEVIKEKFKDVNLSDIDEFFKTFPFEFVYSPKNVKQKLFKIRDDEDYLILHTAIIENVDILITGDKDFEDIEIDKPEILKPSEFLNRYYNNN